MLVFMLTDIEASSEKWERNRLAMNQALIKHDSILRLSIEQHSGKVVKHTGDGFFAVFNDGDPLGCAIDIERMIQEEDWNEISEMRVRIALNSGEADKHGEDYYGPAVNCTARMLTAAWGGQILLSPEVRDAVLLPDGSSLIDLGVHVLKDINEPQHILQLQHPVLRLQSFPELRSLSSHPHNLPPETTPFLGRESELAQVVELIHSPSCRLLTLVGVGGMGKTRLALKTASETLDHFRYGIYFIPLAPLDSPEKLITTLADVLKFSFYSREEPKHQLINYLMEKELLLIFDSFEHLMTGTDFVTELLEKTHNLKVLITSRERLNIAGEHIFEVTGMMVPTSDSISDLDHYDAVQLFLENVKRLHADYSPSDDDKKCIVHICRLLGGMPLGIELASSWIRYMDCKDIQKEIEQDFDFLSATRRDLPERQQSVRGVFEYSWKLLNDKERLVFCKLSTFQNGFTRDAAREIAGADLQCLSSLLDKSLINRNASGRFFMHNILRRYTYDKLSVDTIGLNDILEKHAKYYVALLQRRHDDLRFTTDTEKILEVEQEIDNIRAAWNWAIQNTNVDVINNALEGLYFFYNSKSRYVDGKEDMTKAIKKLILHFRNQNNLTIGRLLSALGAFQSRLSLYDAARDSLLESLRIAKVFEAVDEYAFIHNNLGFISLMQSNFNEAIALLEQSLYEYKTVKDEWGIALSLNQLGIVYYRLGDFKKAKQYYEESLVIRKKLGDYIGIAGSLSNLANIYHDQGEFEKALFMQRESLQIKRELGDRRGIAITLNNMGNALCEVGDFQGSKRAHEESLALRRDIGDLRGVAFSYVNLGFLNLVQNNLEQAQKYYEDSLAIRRELSDQQGICSCLTNLADIYHRQDRQSEAQKLIRESLTIGSKIGSLTSIVSILGIACHVLSGLGRNSWLMLVLYAVYSHKATEESYRKRLSEQIIPVVAEGMSSEDLQELKERSKELGLTEIVLQMGRWLDELAASN